MASYLYAVQDDTGREVVSAHVDVEKVGDVTAVREGAAVRLMFEDVVIEEGASAADAQLFLLRWPSDDKLSEPVKHPLP